NYLFANPTSYGYDPRGSVRRDFNALLTRFGDKLKIPRSQIYELSDGAIGRSDYVLGGAANQHRVPKLLKDWRFILNLAEQASAQVWSACSADQYSYEFDDYASFQGFDIKGGAFLSIFFKIFSAGTGGIPRPESPIPVDAMAAKVNEDVKKMFEATVDDEKT